MSERDECPHCGVSLRGPAIPTEQAGNYRREATHFRREVSVEVQGVYDGGLFYECPDCHGRWHRWPEGHGLRVRAEPWVSGLRP